MNKSEIAEKTAREIFEATEIVIITEEPRWSIRKTLTPERIKPFVERAIAESQAPQPDQFLPFLRQIRDLSKWDGPDAAPKRMHEIWQLVSTAIENREWEKEVSPK